MSQLIGTSASCSKCEKHVSSRVPLFTRTVTIITRPYGFVRHISQVYDTSVMVGVGNTRVEVPDITHDVSIHGTQYRTGLVKGNK